MATRAPMPNWARYLIIASLLIALVLLVLFIVQHSWLAVILVLVVVVGDIVQLWQDQRRRGVS